ncbi:MAG: hypothetical protein WD554_03680 [Flavobacteriaceae bacterium]
MTRKQLMYFFVFLAAAITVYGLVTGKFLFLFIWLPLGLFWKGRK